MRRILKKLQTESLKSDLASFEAVLVGRPNTGKSAIWNRLVKKNDAIVSPIAGTTRDRREGKVRLGFLEFTIVDTGGLEDKKGLITDAAQMQTKYAVEEADAIIFCVDAKTGITQEDEYFARLIRKMCTKEKTAILLANKTEGRLTNSPMWEPFLQDCRRLGFGLPVPFSAAQGEGLSDLHDALLESAKFAKQKLLKEIATSTEMEKLKSLGTLDDDNAIRAIATSTIEEQENLAIQEGRTLDESKFEIKITILGRPNAGKSTLVNTILGSDRVVVGPTPGLTRDAIEVEWIYENRPIKLVDTAGWRAHQKSALYYASKVAHHESASSTNIQEKNESTLLEGLAVERSLKALSSTHVAALIIDIVATAAAHHNTPPCISHQDLTIAGKIIEEGKPLIIVVNKIDGVARWESMTEQRSRRKLSVKEEVEMEQSNMGKVPLEEEDIAKMKKWVGEQLSQSIPETRGCPILVMSALYPKTNTVDDFMKAVVNMEKGWSTRISTFKLNRWLREVVASHPPPKSKGITYSSKNKTSHSRKTLNMVPIQTKIKYATQVSTRPPTFAIFVNRNQPEKALDESYKRFLINKIKDQFGFHGIPIRLLIRSTGNPFLENRAPVLKMDQETSGIIDSSQLIVASSGGDKKLNSKENNSKFNNKTTAPFQFQDKEKYVGRKRNRNKLEKDEKDSFTLKN